MTLKYTFRLIKSTLNRFIAILAIVFIGVSFMMGLRSNYDIMIESVERYADDSNLYDSQIYSNYGFDDSDVNAIKNLDYVDDVFASKTRDVYAKDKSGNIHVARVLEIDSNLNTIELESGRWPQSDDECLIITGYTICDFSDGDVLEIYLDDEEVKDSFKNSQYKIVGRAKAIEYMAETFSTSTLANKDLNIVLYINNNNFISDYYTSLFIKYEGSSELFSFDDEYIDYVDERSEKLKDFSKNQSQELRSKIIKDAEEEIEKGRNELEENKAKYQKDLDEAKKKLEDSKIQLDEAKKQIEDGQKQIDSNRVLLANSQKQIDEGYIELKNKRQELIDGKAKLESYGFTIDELDKYVNNLYSRYSNITGNRQKLIDNKQELYEQYQLAREITSKSKYNSAVAVKAAMLLINKNRHPDEYVKLQQEYDAFIFMAEYNRKVIVLDAEIDAYDLTLKTINNTMSALLGMNVQEGYDYIHGSIEQIRIGQQQIEQAYIDLDNAQIQINEGLIALENGQNEINEARVQYEDGLKQYEDGQRQYNEGLVDFNKEIQDAEDKIEDAENKLKDLDSVKWTVINRYNTNYSCYAYKNNTDQMENIGNIIPLLFYIVAALVCSTTMTRLIDEQRSQIGIYRALGFNKGEIISIYLNYVVLASILASIVAVFVGVAIFPTIIYHTWRLMYNLPQIIFTIPIDDLLICIFSFCALMMLVTYIVLSGSLKECSASLLRPKAPRKTSKIILEKWHWLWNKLPFASKITARNLLRYKARFIMTVIGVAGCTGLLLLGWGIKDSISSTVAFQYEKIFKFNYLVDIKNDRHIDDILTYLNDDPNNITVIEYSSYSTNIKVKDKDKTINVIVIDASKQKDAYELQDYRNNKILSLNDDGVIISDKFANTNNIKVGDVISFESQDGKIAQTKVKAICINYVQNYLYVSNKLYQTVFNEKLEYNAIAVRNDKDARLLLQLPDKYRDVNGVSDFTNAIASFNDMIAALDYIILIIIVVAGALAFVVLINLTNVNISERIREIATLKVLGFRRREVNSYIFKEIMLMTCIGAILGLPLGKVIERYIMTVIDMDMCKFPYVIKPMSYVYAFVITIIFAIIVLLMTKKTLKDVQMVESLKSIE